MSRVVITVGAQADRSLVDVVRPLVDAGKRAQAQADRAADAIFRSTQRAAKRAANEEAKAREHVFQIKQRYLQQEERAQAASLAKQTRDAQRAAKEQEKALEHVYQVRQRYLAQVEKERAAQTAARTRTALDVGTGAMRTLGGVGRAGIGVGRDVLRGAGVNWDLGSIVGSGVGMQEQAVALSNAAYRGKPGEQRIDPAALVRQAKEIGNAFAFDPSKALGGLGAYQEKTGDLNTAMAGMQEWSAFAKATNTDLDVLIASAGEVGNALGDAFESPQAKAKAITDVLKTLGAQGQEGAVEFRNLATQMPKLSAASAKFEGDKAENLKKMGALVQLAKQQGGAPSATSAATSISGFANILNTPARINEFENAGIKVFSDKEKGKVRDPFAIMRDALDKTGMDPIGFKKLFANVVGAKPAEALAVAYRDAGGGKGGQEAVDKLLAKFMGSMSDEKLKGDLAAAMGTDASKVQLLNNKLAEMGQELAGKILPKLVEAAPAIMKFVEAMVGAVGWAAENPARAITLAIVASIAKAQIGTAVSGGIQSLVQSTMAGAGGLAGASGAGKAGAALGAIAVGVATFTITSAIIDIVGSAVDKGKTASVADDAAQINAIGRANMLARTGTGTTEDVKALEAERAALQARITEAQGAGVGKYLQGALNPFSDQTLAGASKAGADAEKLGALQGDLAALTAAITSLKGAVGQGIKANVTVTQAAPGVDERGRK